MTSFFMPGNPKESNSALSDPFDETFLQTFRHKPHSELVGGFPLQVFTARHAAALIIQPIYAFPALCGLLVGRASRAGDSPVSVDRTDQRGGAPAVGRRGARFFSAVR